MRKLSVGIIGAGRIGIAIKLILHSLRGSSVPTVLYDTKPLDRSTLPIPPKDLGSDFFDHIEITGDNYEKITKQHDLIVSTAPFFVNVDIAKACAKTKTSYFDITEDVETTAKIKEISTNKATFIPQLGLAPGAINIIANHIAKSFNHIRSLDMRVGAIPLSSLNNMKYHMSWSTEGVINEYCNPCYGIREGAVARLAPMADYETINIDGCLYEAFNTSGGVGDMVSLYEGKADNLSYKTIRYPGHHQYMQFLIDDLDMKNRRELFADIMNHQKLETADDVVLIHVNCIGENKRGVLSQKSFTKKIYSEKVYGIPLSAIQVATAWGVVPYISHLNQDLSLSKKPKGFVSTNKLTLSSLRGEQYANSPYRFA